MRRPDEYHLHRPVVACLAAFSLLFLLQTSCSRHDSNGAGSRAAAAPGTTTNVPVTPAVKGIARVEDVKVAKPVAPPPYHQVFVLSVGINSNPAYGNLRFAVSDATAVADTFRHLYGFTNVTLLTNTLATKANVLAALTDIQGRLSTNLNDDFIFYFSGHGDTWAEGQVEHGKTNVVRSGFLVAYNETTNIPASLTELQERNLEITALASNVVQMPARHRLIFLDSCFSGLAFLNQEVVDKRPDDFNPEVINHRTVQIMTAGLASEQAVEDPAEAHGVFTAALLKQLTSGNILTMEEVFFPLRVAVRNSLNHVEGSHVMTPQLRYLVYNNGSFLFVPLDQLPVWASAKSDNPGLAEADTKGFFRPVSMEDATNVQSAATATPDQRQALVDRYEARSAMGDPLATIALAQIYKGGLGGPADPVRAKIYTSESSDFMTAGNTLNIAALAGITNQALQAIVGGLVQGYTLNELFGAHGRKLTKEQNALLLAAAGAKIAAPVIGAIGKWATGVFTRSPIKRLTNEQKKLKTLLAKPTAPNITSAKKELISCEEDMVKLDAMWPPDKQPAEVGQLHKLVQETETELDQNLPDQAATSMDKAEPLIEALQKIIKSQSGAK